MALHTRGAALQIALLAREPTVPDAPTLDGTLNGSQGLVQEIPALAFSALVLSTGTAASSAEGAGVVR